MRSSSGLFLARTLALLLAGCGGGDFGFGCPGSSPAPPDVSGTWVVSQPTISTTTCTSSINNDILKLIVGPDGTCAFEVDQSTNSFSATNCNNNVFNGCVDGDGNIRALQSLTTTSQGCTLQIGIVFTAASGKTDSAAAYQMTITFSDTAGCGVLTDCQTLVNAAWKKS